MGHSITQIELELESAKETAKSYHRMGLILFIVGFFALWPLWLIAIYCAIKESATRKRIALLQSMFYESLKDRQAEIFKQRAALRKAAAQ